MDVAGRRGHGLDDACHRMVGALAHRGPDDEGVWTDPGAGVALGHRRLAVVGLGRGGHQPMTSADGRIVLSFNGEVYNHEALRRQVRPPTGTWRGSSDTEVLLELVADVGVREALARCVGMFAVAVWDRKARVLTLARDRLGEKPLCYRVDRGRLVFASELGALLALPGADRSLDRDAVAGYLRRGFVVGGRSVVAGVRRLPPGHLVTASPDAGPGKPEPWWSVADVVGDGAADPLDATGPELVEAVEKAVLTAVRDQLVADVPVGAFLSGGIDSSLVCALAQSVAQTPVRTFSVGFDDPAADESAAAAAVASALGTRHTPLHVRAADAGSALETAVSVFDEPFADPSAIPTAAMCAAARRHVTVCLSGDGGDEVFAGYNRYRAAYGVVGRGAALPGPVRGLAAAGLDGVPSRTWDSLGRAAARLPGGGARVPSDIGVKAHKLAGVLRSGSAESAYDGLRTVVDPVRLGAGAGAFVDGGLPGTPLSPLRRMLLRDMQSTLPEDMLTKVDRASMAVALEVRVPLLDHRVVALAARLPELALVREGVGKWVLRQVLARHLPPGLVDRPKRGFDPPLGAWLRGPLRDRAHDLLSAERLAACGIGRPEPVRRMLSEHAAGRRDHTYALWTLLVLQQWQERTQAAVVGR